VCESTLHTPIRENGIIVLSKIKIVHLSLKELTTPTKKRRQQWNQVLFQLCSALNSTNFIHHIQEDIDKEKMRYSYIRSLLRIKFMLILRNELAEYLQEFKEKKGTDGRALVYFPKNFDSVVEAMSRKDLISSDAK
jgi:hypothetical protein